MLTDSPGYDFLKRIVAPIVFLICFFVFLAIMAGAHEKCQHDINTIEFYDKYRVIPGQAVRVQGDEITVATKDSKRLSVKVLYKGKFNIQQDKYYLFGYCDLCRLILELEALQ